MHYALYILRTRLRSNDVAVITDSNLCPGQNYRFEGILHNNSKCKSLSRVGRVIRNGDPFEGMDHSCQQHIHMQRAQAPSGANPPTRPEWQHLHTSHPRYVHLDSVPREEPLWSEFRRVLPHLRVLRQPCRVDLDVYVCRNRVAPELHFFRHCMYR